MRNSWQAEVIARSTRYQTLRTDKNSRRYHARTKLKKSWRSGPPIAVKLLTKPKSDSCKARIYVYLAWISKEMHMNRDVSVCLILVSYVGTQGWCGDDVVARPPHIQMRCWAQHLRPNSVVWPCHTYCVWPLLGAPKILLICTEYNRLTTLAPTNEAIMGSMRKKPYRRKITLYWVEWSVRVVSFWGLTTVIVSL